MPKIILQKNEDTCSFHLVSLIVRTSNCSRGYSISKCDGLKPLLYRQLMSSYFHILMQTKRSKFNVKPQKCIRLKVNFDEYSHKKYEIILFLRIVANSIWPPYNSR